MNLENLFIKQIMIGPMANYAYLVGDKGTKETAVIDPGWEGARLIEEAGQEDLKITHILATHTHFDHVNEVPYMASKLNVPVYVHKSGASAFSKIDNVIQVDDGDKIKVGGFEFEVIYTPGHSAGSVCYKVDNAIFTGDTLFVDGIGRVDLGDSDPEAMYRSLARLRTLPDKMIVYPGHDYGSSSTSTMGEQKRTNPYLQERTMSDFFRIA